MARKALRSGYLRYTAFLLTAGMGILAIVAAIGGLFEIAGQIASICAAFATVLLASLTAQYADQTEKLVSETEKDRQSRLKAKEKENEREVQALRRALYEEIYKIQYFESLTENYSVGNSVLGIATPNKIYESNTSKIGLLSDEEIDSIVEYYTRLERASETIEYQKRVDTTIDKGALETYFHQSIRFQRWLVRMVTLGKYGTKPSERRNEMVREQMEKLAEAQKRAIESLESHLDDPKS